MNHHEDALIGRQLANFRVDRLLGSGGMAQVYYGWDVKLERPVAIKVIDARYQGNAAFAERFVREAQAVAAWHHENIIQVHYADEEDGLYYFVMEYIDGRSLAEVLAEYAGRGELMPQDEILRIVEAVAGALDYAHERGIIHRDIKPANVMLAQDGRIVLADFGLALDMSQGTVGEVFGTPHYISPEQARSSAEAVPESDIYSLGVMLYEMLTGIVPFDDPSITAVAIQHITLPPPPPRDINPDISPAVEEVILKALAKQPEDRYPTSDALAGALKDAFESGEVTDVSLDSTLPPPPVDVPPVQASSVTTQTHPEAGPTEPVPVPPPSDGADRRILYAVGAGIVIVAALIIVLLLTRAGGKGTPAAGDMSPSPAFDQTIEARLTQVALQTTEVVEPTTTLTETSTLLPTATPTATEGVETAAAILMAQTQLAQADAATSTALAWTDTPTADLTGTLEALLARAASQTANAMPKSLTPSVTPTETATPTSTATFTLTHTATYSATPTFTSTSTVPPTDTPPPSTTYTPTLTPIPPQANLLFFENFDQGLEDWQYDPAAWQIIEGDGGPHIQAIGSPSDIAALSGAFPALDNYQEEGFILRMRFRIPENFMRGRVILGSTRYSYGARIVPTGTDTMSLSLYEISSPDHYSDMNNGNTLTTWTFPVVNPLGWHEFMMWVKGPFITLYVDKHPGLRWEGAAFQKINRIALQGEGPSGWEIDGLQILLAEPVSTHFPVERWPENWQRSAPAVGGTFYEFDEENYAVQLKGPGMVTLDAALEDVAFTCRYSIPIGGMQLRLQDGEDGAYVLDFDGGTLYLMQERSDGSEIDLGVYEWFYVYPNSWGSLGVEVSGGDLRVYQNGELHMQAHSDAPPGPGPIRFVLEQRDTVWLDDCLIYQPGPDEEAK